ncbi:MAG: hypothetical protein JW730_22670 [Anaerolineales bacterium]|nr:hypothetical protein [Anaerolineales bacterium]
MNKRPLPDRSVLLPIGISVFSIVGILIIFLTVYRDTSQAVVPADPTATPFKFLLLATETPTPDPALETAPPEEIFPDESAGLPPMNTPEEELSAFPTEASSQSNPAVNNPPPGSTTAQAGSSAQLNIIDTFDDADPRLQYDGDWISQTGVGNASQGTLFVSNTIGSDVTFLFFGQQIIIGYLSEPGLGFISISIDDNEFQADQSAGSEWTSPQFSDEEHFVIIIHESGDSVNLDYINILSSE